MSTADNTHFENMELESASTDRESHTPLLKRSLAILRNVGMLSLLASALLFVMRDVAGEGKLSAYLTFFAFSTLLLAGGWLTSGRWKDRIGGRALLGLGAALLPAHMAQMAGFFHAWITHNSGSDWMIGGGALGTMAVITIPMLALGCWLGFAAWVRPVANRLAPLYFLLNLALLLPVRDGNQVAALITLCAIPCWIFIGHMRIKETALGTPDGMLARVVFLPPFALLIGRCILKGSPTALLASAAFALLGAILYFTLPRESRSTGVRNVSRLLGLSGFGASWAILTTLGSQHGVLPETWSTSLIIWPPMALALALLTRDGGAETRVLRQLICMAMALWAASGWITQGIIPHASMSLAFGILCLLLSFASCEKWMLRMGAGFAFAGLGGYACAAIAQVDSLNWLTLAVTGLALVLGVGFLENRGTAISHWYRQSTRRFDDWS
jgi:hypothetical protein